MDILFYVNVVLLWAHFFALVLGMGSGMASGVVAQAIPEADEANRPRLWGIYKALSRNGHIGLGGLIVTGLILVFSKYGGIGNMPVWFWVKIALVVVLIISISTGMRASKRIQAGDASAMPTARAAGAVNGISGILIILAAVLAFE